MRDPPPPNLIGPALSSRAEEDRRLLRAPPPTSDASELAEHRPRRSTSSIRGVIAKMQLIAHTLSLIQAVTIHYGIAFTPPRAATAATWADPRRSHLEAHGALAAPCGPQAEVGDTRAHPGVSDLRRSKAVQERRLGRWPATYSTACVYALTLRGDSLRTCRASLSDRSRTKTKTVWRKSPSSVHVR